MKEMPQTGLHKRVSKLFQALNGRPLASVCGSFIAGAAVGVSYPPALVLTIGMLATIGIYLVERCRLLHLSIALFSILVLWMGAIQGMHYTLCDEALWRKLPTDSTVITLGEVLSEPSLRRGYWRFVFRAEKVISDTARFDVSCQFWVMVPKSQAPRLFAGEYLRMQGRLLLPKDSPRSSSSWVEYLRRQGVSRVFRAHRVEKVDSYSRRWRVVLSSIRQKFVQNLSRHLPGDAGVLAVAIVLNERTGLDNNLREAFRRTGTVHILSPSGTHVSMLALTIWLICAKIGLSRRSSALSVIAVIWGFAFIAGASEPTLRAAIMGMLVASAVGLYREVDLPTSLAFAGFVLVCLDVQSLLDPGFQFSFVLVAALIASSGWLGSLAFGGKSKPVQCFRKVLAGLCGSTVCMVASAPLTALYYGQMSLISPIANLLIALPVQIITCGGMALALFSAVPQFMSAPIAISAQVANYVVRALSNLQWACIDAAAPTRLTIIVSYSLLFTTLMILSWWASKQRRLQQT